MVPTRLLRNSKPLTSEHPSEYGELYTGAAGAPKHWLLASNSSASAPPRSFETMKGVEVLSVDVSGV